MINGKAVFGYKSTFAALEIENYNCNDFHEVLVQLVDFLDGKFQNFELRLPPAYLLGSSYEMFKQHFQRVDYKNVIETNQYKSLVKSESASFSKTNSKIFRRLSNEGYTELTAIY